jgi:hypothetical protein
VAFGKDEALWLAEAFGVRSELPAKMKLSLRGISLEEYLRFSLRQKKNLVAAPAYTMIRRDLFLRRPGGFHDCDLPGRNPHSILLIIPVNGRWKISLAENAKFLFPVFAVSTRILPVSYLINEYRQAFHFFLCVLCESPSALFIRDY